MGFTGSLFGTKKGGTGGAGLNFSAQQAPLIEAVSAQDAQKGLGQQQAFIQALQAQNGVQNQADVFNQYQALAQGQGPSVAENMLNQQTNQNIQNQAALMASARGAAANPAAIARQAAMQGAAAQQQAAAQAATMRSQEQLGALNQMGNIAGQQVGQQANAIQNYNQNTLGAIANINAARVGGQSSANAANAGVSQVAAKGQMDMFGKVMGAAGSAAGGMHKGGEVKPLSNAARYMAEGGTVAPMPEIVPIQIAPQMGDPNDYSKNTFGEQGNRPVGGSKIGMEKSADMAGGHADMKGMPMVGGDVAMIANKGAYVPGKAKVKGDSYKNDIVHALLSPGEIVIPRSIAQSKDAPEKSAEFVAAVLAKNKHSKPKKKK